MTHERQKLLGAIAELFDRYPQWRIGQLVTNVAEWADQTVWDIEDAQWLLAARAHLDQLAASEWLKA